MVTRMTRKTVTFRKPFVLDGFDRAQPPGDYVVETDEELLDTMTRVVLRRTETRIDIQPRPGNPTFRESVPIDPADLEQALARDAAAEAAPASGGTEPRWP